MSNFYDKKLTDCADVFCYTVVHSFRFKSFRALQKCIVLQNSMHTLEIEIYFVYDNTHVLLNCAVNCAMLQFCYFWVGR